MSWRGQAWFWFGVLIGAWSVFAFAESVPATPSNGPVAAARWDSDSRCGPGVSSEQCGQRNCAGLTYYGTRPIGSGFWRAEFAGCSDIQNPQCGPNDTKDMSGQGGYGSLPCTAISGYTCPPSGGWTLNGSMCERPDCTSLQERSSQGVCENKCSKYEPGYAHVKITGGVATTQYFLQGTGDLPDTLCMQTFSSGAGDTLCLWELSGFGAWGSGSWVYSGPLRATGQSCASATAATEKQPNSPEADCLLKGQSYGTVNGRVVCVDAAKKQKETVSQKTATHPDQTVGSETERRVTTCEGTECVTTITSTVTGGGVSGTVANGTTSSQTTGDGACEGEQAFSAACAGGAEGGPLPEESPVVAISPAALPTAAGCPAPIALPRGAVLDLQPVCEGLGVLRLVVVATAWVTAGFLVVGGFRGAA